ncbi:MULTISPECIES: hypothetical protein [unclassified Psychrobacter]|uniref:hypothetical protein n=1 Tax=unclassified Psychrobacter TaxID=196806 RepID=UPI0025D3B224|nr:MULTISPECIES: hypothetical protein [unclassified Psychrobacter]
MRKLTVFLAASCFAMFAHAERYDVYVHEQVQPNNAALLGSQAVIDTSNWGNDFAEGQNIRKAWDARKARKKHAQAMQEMNSLDLSDNNAVMEFAKKYPDSVDSLKSMLQLQRQLTN